jgi:adenylyltransferase/sulfurtransferase
MGVLQALETIKVIVSGRHQQQQQRPPNSSDAQSQQPPPPAAQTPVEQEPQPTLLLFSSPTATATSTFRTVRMRGRRPDCFACSANSTLTLDTLRSGSLDYVQFCGGAAAPVRILRPEERISAVDYSKRLVRNRDEEPPSRQEQQQQQQQELLLDVREREHFGLGSIEGAVNVPFSMIQTHDRTAAAEGTDDGGQSRVVPPDWIPRDLPDTAPIFVVCRVGNDSQAVVRRLKDLGMDAEGDRLIVDIEGGIRAWKKAVDPTMPFA